MDFSEKHISKLINGDVQLTPEVAVRLETVLGVPARFWNNLEAIYREKVVKAEAENTMDEDEIIARRFPYSEMAKHGWIQETRNLREKVTYLRQYFGVVKLSALDNERITKIACRRLAVTDKTDLALMAWAQEARIQARSIRTAPINVRRLNAAVPEIRKMTVMEPDEFGPKIKELLSDNGIALVFLPHLKGSFLQGATFLDGNRFVVGLTARGRDTDKFWFSLFHELAHIVLGHVGKADGTTDADELEADTWSADMLIRPEDFEEFVIERQYSESSILSFAEKQGIAPGIVVGRLQRERLIEYSSTLNKLKFQLQFDITPDTKTPS